MPKSKQQNRLHGARAFIVLVIFTRMLLAYFWEVLPASSQESSVYATDVADEWGVQDSSFALDVPDGQYAILGLEPDSVLILYMGEGIIDGPGVDFWYYPKLHGQGVQLSRVEITVVQASGQEKLVFVWGDDDPGNNGDIPPAYLPETPNRTIRGDDLHNGQGIGIDIGSDDWQVYGCVEFQTHPPDASPGEGLRVEVDAVERAVHEPPTPTATPTETPTTEPPTTEPPTTEPPTTEPPTTEPPTTEPPTTEPPTTEPPTTEPPTTEPPTTEPPTTPPTTPPATTRPPTTPPTGEASAAALPTTPPVPTEPPTTPPPSTTPTMTPPPTTPPASTEPLTTEPPTTEPPTTETPTTETPTTETGTPKESQQTSPKSTSELKGTSEPSGEAEREPSPLDRWGAAISAMFAPFRQEPLRGLIMDIIAGAIVELGPGLIASIMGAIVGGIALLAIERTVYPAASPKLFEEQEPSDDEYSLLTERIEVDLDNRLTEGKWKSSASLKIMRRKGRE